MSNVNYNLNNKGVRLISSDDAWIIGKNGKVQLNPRYQFIGKMDTRMPNMIITASDKQKPTFKGCINELNITAKKQIVNHFYDEKGHRNGKTKAYFVIEKKNRNK